MEFFDEEACQYREYGFSGTLAIEVQTVAGRLSLVHGATNAGRHAGHRLSHLRCASYPTVVLAGHVSKDADLEELYWHKLHELGGPSLIRQMLAATFESGLRTGAEEARGAIREALGIMGGA